MPWMESTKNSAPSRQESVTFAHLWQQGRWLRNATVTIDPQGQVQSVHEQGAAGRPGTPPGQIVPGLTLPGMPNAHCHGFQRPLGALTQRAAGGDNFWSWRETMYALAASLDAEALSAISARCYLELLRGGYTRVAEFLYLHRLDAARLGALEADAAVAAAASLTGIDLMLLPTLYQYADFGGAAPRAGQLPFVRGTRQFLDDWRELLRRYPADGPVTLGVAFHSLRAVNIDTIGTVTATLSEEPRCQCLHIHVAEQMSEVENCIAQHGQPPVALLASRGLLSARWALVHATHASTAELEQVREAGATVVLCPTTESDLGDGVIDIGEFLLARGSMAIGSDSNIGRNALDELRVLEWSQRLSTRRRNVLADPQQPAVADRLYDGALQGGARAFGPQMGASAADFVSFDGPSGDWSSLESRDYLSALMFDSAALQAQQVMVGGRWVIRQGRHAHEEQIETHYRETMRRLGRIQGE